MMKISITNLAVVTLYFGLLSSPVVGKYLKSFKSSKSKSSKSTKSRKTRRPTNKPTVPSTDPPSEIKNSDRTLNQNLQKTVAIREGLRAMYKYDVDAKNNCIGDTTTHRNCIYDMFKMGGDFECECRPVDSAEIFEAFDVNNDDYITLKEVQNYFDSDPCEPTFTYEGTEYTGCTTAGDVNGRAWCSIRVLNDNTHAVGFYKYCNSEDNVLAWEEALIEFDINSDGLLSFEETITHTQERRRRLQKDLNQSGGNCNDCEPPLYCGNPIVAAIDGECRNYIKTIPFDETDDDEKLLQMLGAAMNDSYDDGSYSEREGMDGWITRTKLSPYPETDDYIVVLSCVAVAGAQSDYLQDIIETQAALYISPLGVTAGMFLLNKFLDVANVLLECGRVFNELTDGRDALQWATYTINQGIYTNRTILAYMGTNPGNLEQLIADLWSVPLGNAMMRNMTDDAVNIALGVIDEVGGKENLFITGHSLGGIVAELVCSELAIEGASFGAIGAFDPYTLADEAVIGGILGVVEPQLQLIDQYTQILLAFGFEGDEIQEMMDEFTVSNFRNMLIKAEYNGLIISTAHAGVKFEVVKNEYDYVARQIGSMDGSQCSHIASSCDVRKLWFEATLQNTGGHSPSYYQRYVSAQYSRGWEDKSLAVVDWEMLFLPGVKKNVVCDRCEDGRNEWCESGNCYEAEGECRVDDRLPTYCPADSRKPDQRADCPNGNDDCKSGRCDAHEEFVWSLLGYKQCYEKNNIGESCNENSDCQSGYCHWWYYECASA